MFDNFVIVKNNFFSNPEKILTLPPVEYFELFRCRIDENFCVQGER